MTEPDEVQRERAAKIAAIQRLIDEERASGHSDKTMEDVRREAKEYIDARRRT